MIKSVLTFLLVILLTPQAYAKIIDRVVAVVNDDLVTLSELNEEGAHFFKKIEEEAPANQRDAALHRARKKVLDAIVDRKLLLQRAKRRGVTISPEEIDMQYFAVMEKNGFTEKQFAAELAKIGSSPARYKKSLEAQLVRQRLISYEIRSKVVITNEAIERYYHEEYGLENKEDGLHILQIGILWGPGHQNTTKQEAKLKAEQMRAMVMDGEEFEKVAHQYSDLPSAKDGGDIGVLAEDDLSPTMRQGLAGLRPGQISRVLATPSGFQFFKLLSSRKGNVISQAPLALVRDEIRAILYDREMKEKFDKWVVTLREHSYIKEQL